MKVAKWWSRELEHEGKKEEEEERLLRCALCPHECRIENGGTGICGVRKNVGMQLYTLNYGRICVAAVDSIEKKPIFHYRPGSIIYSVGTVGCNLDCANCQNFQLARGNIDIIPFKEMKPEELVSETLLKGAEGIGWTFNEPTVWAEFVMDTSEEGRRKGLYSMMNTNGFIAKGAREDLLPCIDVMKIDVKSFRDEFYRKICNGRLDPVLETCVAAMEYGTHVELAYLMIPQLNDSDEELREFSKWVAGTMGSDVPVHLFRFSPAFRMAYLPNESPERMLSARAIAMRAGLRFVYFGGLVSAEEQATRCPRCGEVLISRMGEEPAEKVFVRDAQMSRFCPSFSNVKVNIKEAACPRCGEPIKIRLA